VSFEHAPRWCKVLPRLLTPNRKAPCCNLSRASSACRGWPILHVEGITGDGSRVYGYEPETKQQSSQWKIPKTEEGKAEPQRKLEHAHRVFRHLRDCAPWICPRRPDRERGILLQCSSPSEGGYSAKTTWTVVRGQLAAPWWQSTLSPSSRNAWVFRPKKGIITLPHPPYSPDLAPPDFFLFPKMKLQLKVRRFDRVEEIQRESQNALGTLRVQDFQHAFQQWQRRWDRCVAAQRDYFEGDAAQT